MNKFGKTIKLFLIDGEPNGRMSCELSNWTGKAFKIPRKKIKISSNREELQGTGIYILFGKETAYIGEAEEIHKRLTQHLPSKDFWNEAIVFVSKYENLNKAHIKYIESRLYEIATNVNRYELENGNNPPKPKISESDEAEMEEFISNIKLLINALGFKIFEELIEANQTEEEKENTTFYLQSTKGGNASGQSTDEGFVVLKDSLISTSTTPSFPKSSLHLREELISKGVIIDQIFQEDYLFSSPSSAATFVMGRSANGLTECKLKNGRILKAIETS